MKKVLFFLCSAFAVLGLVAIPARLEVANATTEEDIQTLLSNYIGGDGIYTKKTTIGLNSEARSELSHFHCELNQAKRTTYYNGQKLLLAEEDGTVLENSGSYVFNTDKVERRHATEDMTDTIDFGNLSEPDFVQGTATKLEDYYVTLNTFMEEGYFADWSVDANGTFFYKLTEAEKDVDKDGKYVSKMWNDFLAFCAPMFYPNATYIAGIDSLSISESVDANGTSYLKLSMWLDDVECGKLDEPYFAEARIYTGNTIFEEELLNGDAMFLQPLSAWLEDGAAMAAYVTADNMAGKMVALDKVLGPSTLYTVELGTLINGKITFCRMNPNLEWTLANALNKTPELTITAGSNVCVVTGMNEGGWAGFLDETRIETINTLGETSLAKRYTPLTYFESQGTYEIAYAVDQTYLTLEVTSVKDSLIQIVKDVAITGVPDVEHSAQFEAMLPNAYGEYIARTVNNCSKTFMDLLNKGEFNDGQGWREIGYFGCVSNLYKDPTLADSVDNRWWTPTAYKPVEICKYANSIKSSFNSMAEAEAMFDGLMMDVYRGCAQVIIECEAIAAYRKHSGLVVNGLASNEWQYLWTYADAVIGNLDYVGHIKTYDPSTDSAAGFRLAGAIFDRKNGAFSTDLATVMQNTNWLIAHQIDDMFAGK